MTMLKFYFRSLFSCLFHLHYAISHTYSIFSFLIFMFFLSLFVTYASAGLFINKNIPLLLARMPRVTFQNGVLTAPDKTVSVYVPGTSIQLVFDASPQARQPIVLNDDAVLWVHQNQLHILTNSHHDTQPLPADMNFTTDPQTLDRYRLALMSALRISVLLAGLLLIPLLMALYIGQAFIVGMIFKKWLHSPVPAIAIFRWAMTLSGPCMTLFYIRLWVHIPLYSLAQLFLCIIYIQLIFRTLDTIDMETMANYRL